MSASYYRFRREQQYIHIDRFTDIFAHTLLKLDAISYNTWDLFLNNTRLVL